LIEEKFRAMHRKLSSFCVGLAFLKLWTNLGKIHQLVVVEKSPICHLVVDWIFARWFSVFWLALFRNN
jgi:hypothetical protein